MEIGNIMIRIENFLKGKKEKRLFYSLGKNISVKNGWIVMHNNKNNTNDNLTILTDENGRIRCKSDSISFSLQKEGEKLVIDHLQLKEQKEQDYKFSLRRKKENGKEIYRIHTKKEETETIYWFKGDELSITKITPNKMRKNYFFIQKEEIISSNVDQYQKKECWTCFKELEEEYATITSYIGENISPILSKAIEYCNPYKMEDKQIRLYQKKKV